MSEIISKNLDDKELTWNFLDGSRRTAVILESFFVGRGTYLPGWKWSEHVGRQTGKNSENHVGYIISGQMVVKGADGKEIIVGPGDAFEANAGHDAWVVGNKPCLALDFGCVKNEQIAPDSHASKSLK